MKTPPKLKKGDKVAIVSPAKKIAAERIENAVNIFESWGLKTMTGRNVLARDNYFAGSDEERIADFQEMLDDSEVKAIVCARGGYGTIRIVDKLDFTRFSKNPKWIVGFSDITVLHSHIARHFGIETIHAPMPLDYSDERDTSVEMLRRILFGEKVDYEFDTDFLSRKGQCRGEMVGGNLSVIYSLNGSVSEIDTDKKILFIEEVGENLYHFDRMIQNLKRAGKFENLNGLVVGHLSGMKDNDDSTAFNKSARQIIREAVDGYDFPVCYGFPAGHEKNNKAFIHGREVSLIVGDEKSRLLPLPPEGPKKQKGIVKNLAFITLVVVGFFLVIYLIYSLAIKLLT